jgi:RNA polymerase primary sigma factor
MNNLYKVPQVEQRNTPLVTPDNGGSAVFGAFKYPNQASLAQVRDRPTAPSPEASSGDFVGIHLAEMCRYPRLSRAEELEITAERDKARDGYYQQLLGSDLIVTRCLDAMKAIVESDAGYGQVLSHKRPSRENKDKTQLFLRINIPTIERLLGERRNVRVDLRNQEIRPTEVQRLLLREERITEKIVYLCRESGLSRDALFDAMEVLIKKAEVGMQLQSVVASPRRSSEDRTVAAPQLAQVLSELGESPHQALARTTLAQGYAEQEVDAKKRLALGNLLLVFQWAKKYEHRGIPLLDLIQMGEKGLMVACDKYDASRGVKFGTLAVWWIRQAIEADVPNFARIIEVPRGVISEISRVNRERNVLRISLGRDPSDQELSAHLHQKYHLSIEPNDLARLDQWGQMVESLDASVGSHDSTKADFVPASTAFEIEETIELLTRAEYVNALTCALAMLEHKLPQLAKILRLRFGLGGREQMTLREVGEEYGVTKERIRQLETRALCKLKEIMERDPRLQAIVSAIREDVFFARAKGS